jgi:hypothetical protein
MGHPRRVDRNPLEPRVEPVRVAHSTELTPCRDERVLGGIARVGLVAEDRHAQSIHAIHPDTHDLLERVEVAVASPFDERSVCRG